MPAVLELGPVSNGGDDGGRGLRADALDLGDPLASPPLRAEDAVDLLVEGCDPTIEIDEQIVQFADGLTRQGGELVVDVTEDLRDHAPCPGDALGKGDAAVKLEATDLADHGGSVVYHALTRAMQGLDILLLDCLLRHETHVSLAGCRADCLGIVAVILLATHEWLHILRADDPDLVAQGLELAAANRTRWCRLR